MIGRKEEIKALDWDFSHPESQRALGISGTTANCRITAIAVEGIKPGMHASVAQNILTLDDFIVS